MIDKRCTPSLPLAASSAQELLFEQHAAGASITAISARQRCSAPGSVQKGARGKIEQSKQ
jgi:hypothetical protein